MAPQLRAALAGLCRRHGWSYGVVWRVDHRDPRLLVVEDNYWEEQVGIVVEDMLNRVHMVGEGSIGGSIISGKDEWIYHDAYDTNSDPIVSVNNPEAPLVIVDLMHQFLAGIKTIVITSLQFSGVVQFGSTNKIPESSEFIDKAKDLFQLIGSMPEPFSHVDPLKETKIRDQHQAFASAVSAGDAYCGFENTQSFYGKYRKQMTDMESLEGPSQSPAIFPRRFSHHFRPHYSMNPYAFSKPITSSFVGASIYLYDQLQKSPSCSRTSISNPTIQDDGVSDEAHGLLSPSAKSLSSLDSHENTAATCVNPNSCAKVPNLPIMEQGLLSGTGVSGCSSSPHTNSFFSVPCKSAFRQLCADSSSSSEHYGLQDSMTEGRFSVVSNACLSESEKLPLMPHNLHGAKIMCSVPSFAPELLGASVANFRDSTPDGSSLLHTKDDYLVHLTDQRLEHVGYDFTVQMNEKQLAASSASPDLGGSDSIICNMTSKISRIQVESSSGAVVGSHNQENSLIEPGKLLMDYDLFDGMDLDLSTDNFPHRCWDDIVIPTGGGNYNYSNFSVSVSECLSEMQMGSTAGPRNGLQSEAALDQLSNTIDGQIISEGPRHGCLAKSVNPIANPDTENQFSMVTNVGSPSVYNSQVPSVCLPSVTQTPNVLLPHCISDIIHGSAKEALPKSNFSMLIDDCCSMNNESYFPNQPKKPEEAAKFVKKRARPGESTRPRPKDRQQIQDRVKELREIVPNGAKCSIDGLLDRTIKHMLFLQSVTKYADKLKQAEAPKMIVEESGVVLKDNTSSGSCDGATWAYEVAGQTMFCPIMVEDLTPPGQMLVEMLCEERGIFLEIADIIRGLGLTILKGVMEIHERKVWARFLVEANRDVTRLDIFLSLVQLLQHTSSIQYSEQATENVAPMLQNCRQCPISVPSNEI
ncbi:hypothetical protein MUK42_02687 [Musa troglodytarum]|uniref:BHLH domain-containing protein n=2 Tax=Musa troglodytarum TaxID=320322 RepID=A0A9E7JGW9_9LILI|nr:hypothetical protein MUK42_02687 [Musa troglodytarum]